MEGVDVVRDIAAKQHGVVTLAQIKKPITRRVRLGALADGWLIEAARGVYVLAGSVPTVERALTIGLFQLGPGALVSHEAAARLHRFDRTPADAVEFTVLRSQRGGGRGLTVHSANELGPTDAVRVDGFPCTSATRTILDLARTGASRDRLAAAIDSAVRSGASAPSVIARRLEERRGPGHWGAPLVASLLPDTGGHSWLERRFLSLVRRAGLPRPNTQVIHRRGTRTIARADFVFDPPGMVVEVSGRIGHATDDERARDAQRRNELQEIGRQVFEFTYRHVTEQPDVVIATLRRLLPAT